MSENSKKIAKTGVGTAKEHRGSARTGQPTSYVGGVAGHTGEPAGSLVMGPVFTFSEAISTFLWEKESKNARKRVWKVQNWQVLLLKTPHKRTTSH